MRISDWSSDVCSSDLPFANRPYVTWGALRDELFVVTADGYGPEVEGMLSRHVSTLGHPAKVSIHQVGRENLMNMVGMGFGLALASASTLGVVYRGVKFVPVVDDHDKLRVSAVWSAKNDNAALKRLVDMIATGRSIILNRTPM